MFLTTSLCVHVGHIASILKIHLLKCIPSFKVLTLVLACLTSNHSATTVFFSSPGVSHTHVCLTFPGETRFTHGRDWALYLLLPWLLVALVEFMDTLCIQFVCLFVFPGNMLTESTTCFPVAICLVCGPSKPEARVTGIVKIK